MRKSIVVVAALVTLAGSTACATKKYVNTRTGEVDRKVEGLSKQVEETQGRVQQNEKMIAETDRKAGAAGETATRAQDAAGRAQGAADTVNTKVGQVANRVEEVDKASRRLIYEVVLSDDKTRFQFGQTRLAPAARAELDKLAGQLKGEQRAVWVEVEGHTDNVGTAKLNQRIALERAEAVKRYLYEQHKVPLHKINVISYGEEKPVAPNRTREGRSQNRRVVVRVLA